MAHDLCTALETASRGWTGDAPSGAMLTSTRAFLAAAAENTALLSEVASSLGSYEPGAAIWIAVTCGTAVERGAPAGLTGPAIFDLLRSWLPKLPVETSSEPEVTPEQTALLTLFRYLAQSTVTHLAHLPAHRELMGKDLVLIDRLDELRRFSYGAVWVGEALLKASGGIILLHPPSGTGVQARYTNVSNCFHLFSLLQTAIGTSIAGGRTPSAAIARVARGTGTEQVNDEAWWHYGIAMRGESNLATTIWGEGLARDIPSVDGVQVILAWPALLGARTWDAGFLGPHLEALPADAVVERALTIAECEAWMKRLGLGPKKSWRFW